MKNGVMMQYFEWYLSHQPHLWKVLKEDAKHLKNIGISAVWMPPAFKGIGGKQDVGYGVYDVYDLGEFDAKGTICTKYGTKDEYLEAIQTLHDEGIDVYCDIVLNHKMGADANEVIKAHEVSQTNKNQIIGDEETIEVATIFNFPSRHDKYSDFHWNYKHFSGIDYDIITKSGKTFLFQGKEWNKEVDDENGNFDYLMGADVDFSVLEVVEEMKKWGNWYYDITKLDGVRLDAVKHISASFYKDWLKNLRNYSRRDLFAVGEYWHGELNHLLNYLNEVDYQLSLFDVPLHYHFHEISHANGNYDMSKIFEGTLVKASPHHAVTFVDNHDTQPSQGLQSWVEDWFKPLAYALILLRQEGYPCVFYGDYYGIEYSHIESKRTLLDQLLYLRNHYAIGSQDDYLDDYNIIGWVRNKEEQPLICIMSDSEGGTKKMFVGKKYEGMIFEDVYCHKSDVMIDSDGFGLFECSSGNLSIYMVKGEFQWN